MSTPVVQKPSTPDAPAPEDTPRRWCDEGELGKLAVVRDALGFVSRIALAARGRLVRLAINAEVSTHGSGERAAAKCAAVLEGLLLVEVALLTAQCVSLLLAERTACPSPSLAVPTYLSQFIGAYAATVERGGWRISPQYAAAFVSGNGYGGDVGVRARGGCGGPDGGSAGGIAADERPGARQFESILAKMAKRDRDKFGFNLTAYLHALSGGKALEIDVAVLSRSMMVLNVGAAEVRARDEGEVSKYRLQREKLRERKRRAASHA
jgi:hypothetical protein